MKTAAASELFRTLPSVDEVMRIPAVSALTASDGHASVVDAARIVLASLRREITTGLLDGDALELALSGLAGAVEKQLRQALSYSLRSVINATGVILHTNLGRAPLSEAVIEHIRGTGASYSNLEFDLGAGARGKRDVHVDRLFRRVLSDALGAAQTNAAGISPGATAEAAVPTRAETATIVVNNNAAAVLLALNTLAEGGEVIVSRGELVEIGGSFRIPDVMAKSGAILCEVGTTNRTRVSDYAQAITERTRLLLRVHRSNFEITGFTAQASTAELVALAGKRGIPVMEDLGSGALFDLRSVGITGEQGVLDSLRSGVDIVTYSGDKLLGGPQAGLISGRSELIARMRLNSLFRALRVDKLIYAALEATLLAYIRRDHDAIPTLRMMHLTKEAIGERARKMAARIARPTVKAELVDGESILGGGAAPSSVLPTIVLALTCDGLSADELAARLRGSDPPIIARVDEGRVLLDLRTVFPEQDVALAAVIVRVVQ
ncbi:MAG TPA: L-seryl-tRNA(Sec) selenium transferase [Candidatus Acidoferrales bacterium]|nr:L-seryl-tRNA(Sec) selenium transferase [Candidatus Acidoferrales bacterium]